MQESGKRKYAHSTHTERLIALLNESSGKKNLYVSGSTSCKNGLTRNCLSTS